MAAADYYTGPNATTPNPNPAFLAPPPAAPQRASSHQSYVYPQLPPSQPQSYNSSPGTQGNLPPPPPYQQSDFGNLSKPRPPFAQGQYQRNSFSHPQRPDANTWKQPQPYGTSPQNQSYFPPPPGSQQYPSRKHHSPPHLGPYQHQNASTASFSSGYTSDPEPHRRRNHHSTTRKKSPHKQRSRSSNTNGFLGAAGGGLIGDLIFPGLGTVGGALAGWIGGSQYDEHKKRRDSNRELEQRQWEEKWGVDRKRSGSHASDSRHEKHDHSPRR